MALETELTWNGDKIIKNVNSGTIRALIRSGTIVKTDAKLLVTVDTGNLRGSIVKALDKSRLTETISTNSEYAFAQEFGKRSQPKYGFTPYMRPALRNNINNIEKIFILEENKALNE